MHKFISILPFLFLGCVEVSATDTLEIDHQFTIPGVVLPPGVSLPPTSISSSFPIDVSGVISKMTDLGSLSFSVLEDQVAGDMSNVSHLEIDLENNKMPNLILVNTDVNAKSQVNEFPVIPSGDQLLPYLSNPCTLSFTLTGTPPSQDTTFNYTLVLSATETVKKSL